MAQGTPISAQTPITEYTRYEQLRSQLEIEQATFRSHWRDLGDFIFPRRPRFSITDVNKGDRRNQKIIDSTATLAARTMRSGMMSGVTSPARPWFRLTTPDADLSEIGAVKDWLYLVTQRMTTVFLKSNLYNTLPIVYGDMGVFATGCMGLEEDFENVIRATPFAIGSYMIANDNRLKVSVFYRTFRLTVRQLVQQFGRKHPRTGQPDWSNFSAIVKKQWDDHQYESWIDVANVIEPNQEFDAKKGESKFKKYKSVYYERGQSGQNQTYNSDIKNFLSVKGYDYLPILAGRWEVNGEDVYGTGCPGMDALGDIKQLQTGERRSAEAIDKMVRPPMVGPSSMKNSRSSILPGDITYLDVREGSQGFRPAYETNPRTMELEEKQQQVRGRIQRAFYEDLFLMLAESDRRQITAREVDERHEEKLLALGPVLEQLNQDILDPLIDITFNIMMRQRMIPKPPEQLRGVNLGVQYLSVMAQAQRLVGIAGIDRFAMFAAQAVQFLPESVEKVDGDKMFEIYGDMTSLPPGIIRTDDQVAQIRAQRQKQQQQQQAIEQAQQVSQTAQNLSKADTGGDNALTQLMKTAQAGNMVPQQ